MIVVHCFFGDCPHRVEAEDAAQAHLLMEEHYAQVHADGLGEMVVR